MYIIDHIPYMIYNCDKILDSSEVKIMSLAQHTTDVDYDALISFGLSIPIFEKSPKNYRFKKSDLIWKSAGDQL